MIEFEQLPFGLKQHGMYGKGGFFAQAGPFKVCGIRAQMPATYTVGAFTNIMVPYS